MPTGISLLTMQKHLHGKVSGKAFFLLKKKLQLLGLIGGLLIEHNEIQMARHSSLNGKLEHFSEVLYTRVVSSSSAEHHFSNQHLSNSEITRSDKLTGDYLFSEPSIQPMVQVATDYKLYQYHTDAPLWSKSIKT